MNQPGLEWVQEIFGYEPRWTKEPSLSIITRLATYHLNQHISQHTSSAFTATFYESGAFNKLYLITAPNLAQQYLMRVSLPVDPCHKTLSEVATIKYVAQETYIPVPGIVAWDADAQNELGFEWILMERMPGESLTRKWRKMKWEAKEALVKRLARGVAQLFDKRYEGIGNLFLGRKKEMQNSWIEDEGGVLGSPNEYQLGHLVSPSFFWGDRLTHNIPRGPFKTSYEWLHTRLQFILTDQERILKTTDDEDDIEDAERSKSLAQDLLEALPIVFPPDEVQIEPSILFHDDLSTQNILVDENGSLTAIVDWEFVSTFPLWRACALPQFLEGRVRDSKPDKSMYTRESPSREPSPDGLDNEGINGLFWEHLLDYERGQLRHIFLSEMQIVQPKWVQIMESSTLKADLENAVLNADNSWMLKCVRKWLEDFKRGMVSRLREPGYE